MSEVADEAPPVSRNTAEGGERWVGNAMETGGSPSPILERPQDDPRGLTEFDRSRFVVASLPSTDLRASDFILDRVRPGGSTNALPDNQVLDLSARAAREMRLGGEPQSVLQQTVGLYQQRFPDRNGQDLAHAMRMSLSANPETRNLAVSFQNGSLRIMAPAQGDAGDKRMQVLAEAQINPQPGSRGADVVPVRRHGREEPTARNAPGLPEGLPRRRQPREAPARTAVPPEQSGDGVPQGPQPTREARARMNTAALRQTVVGVKEGPYQSVERMLGRGFSHQDRMAVVAAVKQQYAQEVQTRPDLAGRRADMSNLGVGHQLIRQDNLDAIMNRVKESNSELYERVMNRLGNPSEEGGASQPGPRRRQPGTQPDPSGGGERRPVRRPDIGDGDGSGRRPPEGGERRPPRERRPEGERRPPNDGGDPRRRPEQRDPSLLADIGQKARELVHNAINVARRVGSVGMCAMGVRMALEKMGIYERAPHAVAFGRRLQQSGHFDRVDIPLHQARPGDIIVRDWSQSLQRAKGGRNHGDVVVVTGRNGDGSLRGANDHINHRIPPDGGRYANSYVLRFRGSSSDSQPGPRQASADVTPNPRNGELPPGERRGEPPASADRRPEPRGVWPRTLPDTGNRRDMPSLSAVNDREVTSRVPGALFIGQGDKWLSPEAARAWVQARDILKERHGIDLRVNDHNGAGRRYSEQADIWRRHQAGLVSRAARPGRSNHEGGNAVDVANLIRPNEAAQVRQVLREVGFIPGDRGVPIANDAWHWSYHGSDSQIARGRGRGRGRR